MGNATLVYGTIIKLQKLVKLLNDLQQGDLLDDAEDEFEMCSVINTSNLGIYIMRNGACCNYVKDQFILLAQYPDDFTTLTRGDSCVKAKLSKKLKKQTKELFKKLRLKKPCMYIVSYDCDSCT